MLTWTIPAIGGKVIIPDDGERVLRDAAKAAAPKETGGTLVGHYEADRSVAVIDLILVAKRAKRGSTWFIRPSDTEDRQLDELYDSSGGKLLYLGEWHTHPRAAARPSLRDQRSLIEIAGSPDVACKTPLLLILGGDLDGPPNLWVTSSRTLYPGASSTPTADEPLRSFTPPPLGFFGGVKYRIAKFLS